MEHWLNKGRPALFEALTAVCDQIGRDFQTGKAILDSVFGFLGWMPNADAVLEAEELAEKKLEANASQEEDESFQKKLAKLEKLEEENHRLRAQLEQASLLPIPIVRTKYAADAIRPPVWSNTNSSDEGNLVKNEWKLAYAKLEKKHRSLKENYRQITTRLRKVVQSRGDWVNYADSRDEYIKELESIYGNASPKRHGERCDGSRPGKDGICRKDVDRPNPSPDATFACAAMEETTIVSTIAAPNTDKAAERSAGTITNEAVAPNLGSDTNDDNEISELDLPTLPSKGGKLEFARIGLEPSSDDPVVISERVVKKRGRKQAKSQSKQLQAKLIQTIKAARSSSPVIVGERNKCSPQESLDLDMVDSRIQTPKKQRIPPLGILAESPPPPGQDDTSLPLQDRLVKAGKLDHDNDKTCLTDGLPSQTPVQPSQLPSVTQPRFLGAYGLGVREVQSERKANRIEQNRMKKRTHSTLRALEALRPVSHNRRIAPSHQIRAGVKRECEVTASRIGDRAGCDVLKKRKMTRALLLDENESDTAGPLAMLLSGRPSSTDDDVRAPYPLKRALPFSELNRQAQDLVKPPADVASVHEAALEVSGDKPVDCAPHQKDPSDLRPDDFKVNPSFNAGQPFAFTEVVRNHNQRTRLPGCMESACCGREFRAMARVERVKGPRTPEQRAAETATLAAYLGDDAGQLEGMDDAERERLWVEARARELSNRLGKHRHRYARPQTPPGFWNADFPTTQELKEEMAEAKRRERQTLMERYREAMRPEGRYKFRGR